MTKRMMSKFVRDYLFNRQIASHIPAGETALGIHKDNSYTVFNASIIWRKFPIVIY